MVKKIYTHSKSRSRKPRPRGPSCHLIFNKPYDVLPQFTDESGRRTLSDFIDIADIYAAGRLDRDSEGLMFLTNDGKLQAKLTHPSTRTAKIYYVQVEGQPTDSQLQPLREGVQLNDGMTLPAGVTLVDPPEWLWPRIPPIRVRHAIPDQWIKLTLYEGRNRQIRRMTAHIGFPTLRLIRYAIGQWNINQLKTGEWRQITL